MLDAKSLLTRLLKTLADELFIACHGDGQPAFGPGKAAVCPG